MGPCISVRVATLVLVLCLFCLCSYSDAAVVALLPIKSVAGDARAAGDLQAFLHLELSRIGPVVSLQETRDNLRRMRLRNADHSPTEELRTVARELGADLLVSVTLHEALRQRVPRLTVSARAYTATEGTPIWIEFDAQSGLDSRTVLGLGVVTSLEGLIRLTSERLVASLADLHEGEKHPRSYRRLRELADHLGTVALIPMSSDVPQDAFNTAAVATEACRAVLFRAGVDLAPGNAVHQTIRGQGTRLWGAIDKELREALRDELGVEEIVTGSVEMYEIGGSEFEPQPEAAISLRVLRVGSDELLWAGGMELGGWDGQSVFRFGRIYSRGALIEHILDTTFSQFIKQTERQKGG